MASDWELTLNRLVEILTDAGQSLSTPTDEVRVGEPSTVDGRLVALWYGGEVESPLGGHTLAKTNFMDRVVVRWYWPVATRQAADAQFLEVVAHDAARATVSRLFGDVHLTELTSGIFLLEDTETGWADYGGKWVRTLTITLGVDLPWTDDISPKADA